MAKKNLEKTTEKTCPLLYSHCRRRCVNGLSEEKCLDGSYKECGTYHALSEENPYLRSTGGFKK